MLKSSKTFLEHACFLRELEIEKILILFLSSDTKVIDKKIITQKKSRETRFSAREIFVPALVNGCRKFIVIHNHPSGSVYPSQNDYFTTLALAEGAQILELTLLDHLIVTKDDYFSFREAGIL